MSLSKSTQLHIWLSFLFISSALPPFVFVNFLSYSVINILETIAITEQDLNDTLASFGLPVDPILQASLYSHKTILVAFH